MSEQRARYVSVGIGMLATAGYVRASEPEAGFLFAAATTLLSGVVCWMFLRYCGHHIA